MKTTQTEPPPPENWKLGLTVQEIKKMISIPANPKKRNNLIFLVQRGPS